MASLECESCLVDIADVILNELVRKDVPCHPHPLHPNELADEGEIVADCGRNEVPVC